MTEIYWKKMYITLQEAQTVRLTAWSTPLTEFHVLFSLYYFFSYSVVHDSRLEFRD